MNGFSFNVNTTGIPNVCTALWNLQHIKDLKMTEWTVETCSPIISSNKCCADVNNWLIVCLSTSWCLYTNNVLKPQNISRPSKSPRAPVLLPPPTTSLFLDETKLIQNICNKTARCRYLFWAKSLHFTLPILFLWRPLQHRTFTPTSFKWHPSFSFYTITLLIFVVPTRSVR